MKLLGAALLLGSAGAWSFLRRLEGQLLLRLGRALLEDLAVFRYHVRVCRTPLPELLEEVLDGGPGADRLWRPLGAILGEKGGDLPRCWRMAVRLLPPPLGKLLAPLGPLLPAGGDPLAAAIEETREELTGFLREETARQAARSRITTALCLAGACLVILVLI